MENMCILYTVQVWQGCVKYIQVSEKCHCIDSKSKVTCTQGQTSVRGLTQSQQSSLVVCIFRQLSFQSDGLVLKNLFLSLMVRAVGTADGNKENNIMWTERESIVSEMWDTTYVDSLYIPVCVLFTYPLSLSLWEMTRKRWLVFPVFSCTYAIWAV